MDNFATHLESIFGIDLAFDASLRGSKDVAANVDNTDFLYSPSIVSLKEEIERLFNLTPRGSFLDDPDYGLDLDWIGQPLNPQVAVGLAKVECLRALTHPDFATRFRVRDLAVRWNPTEPNALRIEGLLEVYGFEEVPLVRFGPYVLEYLLN
ncbi:hypothetical protein H6F43_04070 [Leptolyngbya sp. FACHB-36]|uniref:hypothetical protein n=1 Tax=Leptolyngbya sp. FACHB-36 TaxID=2692808 RepID=UPI0016808551|nr:hypothetical protein [Leptolyngbya sp. FACHB-36]MBD2019359.1 hypothetical protein [Leptolyngbya sp. FACHB-36]